MHKRSEDDVPGKEKKSRRAGSSRRKGEALPEAGNEDAMDEDSNGGVSDDTLSQGKRSKRMKSSSKKKTDISKHLDGLKTGPVADSRTLDKKTVDDVLSERKSGRTLRSTSKKEDALEGLKRLAKDGSSAHKKGRITEDGYHRLGDSNAEDLTSPGKRRSGHNENSISKRVSISEQGRKKKKLSELMAETGRPNSASGGKGKTRGKHLLHDSAEKAEDPDRHSKDTLVTRKRKKLNTLGDLSSQSEPLSRKKSTKVGELMSKAAGSSMLQAAPAVRANSGVSQTKPRRAKHRQVNAEDKSPRPVKVNQGNSEAISEESLSCGEMLWQLSVAACGKHDHALSYLSSIFVHNIYNLLAHVPSMDFQKESTFDMWSTVGVISVLTLAFWFCTSDEGLSSKGEKDSSKDTSTYIKKKLKLKFTKAWLSFLKLPLSLDVYKEVLASIHQNVIPSMSNPSILCDFLTRSYDIGGVISVMALSGLFILMTQHGLEYPKFYEKLYALLTPAVFMAKHWSVFLQVSEKKYDCHIMVPLRVW
ncbi:unnamed protein product [Miscanthus lutarioriparius]|uniref:CCAAT-binding factor domain-containing protein n=1 Tax=Miscanthus lutarioriparius TaxID=422564 RepID=A0A811P5A9_9POAL|nr:unnamed protein product [Miscanthus lutarioriparius]